MNYFVSAAGARVITLLWIHIHLQFLHQQDTNCWEITQGQDTVLMLHVQ